MNSNMRPAVAKVCSRQTARLLDDLEALIAIPPKARSRIKCAIEFTARDVDHLNKEARDACGIR